MIRELTVSIRNEKAEYHIRKKAVLSAMAIGCHFLGNVQARQAVTANQQKTASDKMVTGCHLF